MRSREEIEEKLLDAAKSVFEEDADNITMELELEKLGINSISFIQLIIALEDAFEMEFDNDALDFNRFKTLNDVKEYLIEIE